MRISHKVSEDYYPDLFESAGMLDCFASTVIEWTQKEINLLQMELLEDSIASLADPGTGKWVLDDIESWVRSESNGPFSFRQCVEIYGNAYGVLDAPNVVRDYVNKLMEEKKDGIAHGAGRRAVVRDIRRIGPSADTCRACEGETRQLSNTWW